MTRAFAFLLLLTGCVAETPAQSGKMQARAMAAVDAFASVCLVPDLTVNRAAEAAKAASVGLDAPTVYKSPGSPVVQISARRNNVAIRDPDDLFEWYRCGVEFPGTAADAVNGPVQSHLSKAGFRILSGFNREPVPLDESWTIAPVQSTDGQSAIQYKGRVSRNGKTYVVLTAQSPAGTAVYAGSTIKFAASTRIFFLAQ